MPTYQYECAKCGMEFELFQSMKDNALETCPKDKCAQKRWGRGKVHRKLGTGAGIIFKGSGFYITDYRSENYKAAARKDSEGSKPSGDTAKKSESAAPATPSNSSAGSSTTPSTSAKPAKSGGSKPKAA